jgi:hypothetical protein
MNALPYDGHILDELDAVCQRAEAAAMADELKPFHDKYCRCAWCSDSREQEIQSVRDAIKRDEFLETRCMECEQEVPKVPGTDHCVECLAKIQAEE